MTKFLRTALPLIAAMTATGITSQATALDVTNCTGIGIRVHVYNDNDSVMAIARAGGYIGARETASYAVGRALMAVKVFQTGFFDQLRLTESAVAGNAHYSVRTNANGRWSIVRGRHC